jgi:neutral ceramidase
MASSRLRDPSRLRSGRLPECSSTRRTMMGRVRWCCRCLWLVGLLVLPLSAREAPAQQAWRVGVARVNITPDEPLWMAGYGSRTHEADGKYSDLWVRACALEDATGQRAVLVSFDLLGMHRALSQSLCQSLEQRCGLRRNQVALCFSHTHSGPVVGKNLEPLHYRLLDKQQQQALDRYSDTLQQRALDCVQQSLADLKPCALVWGSGAVGIAVNRRNNPEVKVPELRAAGELKGPCDHDVPVLAARNDDGSWKAVLMGYACHGTVLDHYRWCGDYPGFAEMDVESRLAPCVALFWAGCGADQNPLPRRSLELAQNYGSQLAATVVGVLADANQIQAVAPSLKTAYNEIALPLVDIPTKEQLEQAAQSSDRYQRARAEMLLERLAAGQTLPTTYPYPVQVWTLGDQLQWIFLGGEVVVDYALRLKTELHGTRTWVAAYSNDVMAYIPSLRVMAEGGYEGKDAMVYYGIAGVWSPEVEPLIVEAVQGLVRSTSGQHAVDSGQSVHGGPGEDPHVR